MRIVFMFLTFVVLLGACKGSQPADTTDVLVSVKGRTLNRSEVNKLIPRGISSADSLLLAEGFTKKWVKDVDNKYIPTICALLGVIIAAWIQGWMLTPEVVLSGLISGLASTGLHQVFKQYLEKDSTATITEDKMEKSE